MLLSIWDLCFAGLESAAGAETATKKRGRANSTTARCRRQARSADQSARTDAEKKFAFIFQLSGWAFVAPLCFALQVRDAGPRETR